MLTIVVRYRHTPLRWLACGLALRLMALTTLFPKLSCLKGYEYNVMEFVKSGEPFRRLLIGIRNGYEH